MSNDRNLISLYLTIFMAALLWSLIHPRDYFTWFLEVAPALIGIIVLAATYPAFRFTHLAYVLMLLHAIVLMVGGHYTYAEVPLFNVIRDMFNQSRNNYDKLGHFMQGFAPAIVAREVLLRTSPLRPGKWLAFLVICVCMAISAVYELFEWGATVVSGGESVEAFLGTQGYVWDTQTDMFFALIGAVVAVAVLSRLHDRLIVVRESRRTIIV